MYKLFSLVVPLVIAAVLCSGSTAFAFDETHVLKLNAKGDCRGCALSGANLSGANLVNASLHSADFTGANIEGAD
jgi:uncharacterized protein YjbI with pentapeptide repeats